MPSADLQERRKLRFCSGSQRTLATALRGSRDFPILHAPSWKEQHARETDLLRRIWSPDSYYLPDLAFFPSIKCFFIQSKPRHRKRKRLQTWRLGKEKQHNPAKTHNISCLCKHHTTEAAAVLLSGRTHHQMFHSCVCAVPSWREEEDEEAKDRKLKRLGSRARR